ncbi:hypothetical protein HMPREF9075_00207 [Capnocytophaga sp. oral taxon 332 str. F0381]|nr:hypothetical protein HMPREF9075_00207 [Capnocytophaga sp. oral taxon 332 str. F0381]
MYYLCSSSKINKFQLDVFYFIFKDGFILGCLIFFRAKVGN